VRFVLVSKHAIHATKNPGARMKKELTRVMKPIGVFHEEYMKPAAEDLTIDQATGAPSHGKDIVDGLNATDKWFFKWLFHALAKGEDNDDDNERKMAAHSMMEEGEFSFAEHAAAKLGSESRAMGAKGDKKNAK
jgi:hypothetical protein